MRYFLDTEFIEDGKTIELVSLGLVAEDNRELYFQILGASFSQANEWVWRNVFANLDHFSYRHAGRSCSAETSLGSRVATKCRGLSCPWVSKSEAAPLIRSFCDIDKYGVPEFWGMFAAYDWVAFCQLFGTMSELPTGFPMFCRELMQVCEPEHTEFAREATSAKHHALLDARVHRDVYDVVFRSKAKTPTKRKTG